MEIKVFDINNVVNEKQLEKIDIENINKVFLKIFSPENTDHLKIDCSANDGSVLKKYHEDLTGFDLNIFADELKNAELKKDGSRNKQITNGNLFIKKESNRLTLLKLENIEVVDEEKHYEMTKKFSTESNYYKGCIFSNDLSKITVIDKNKTIAKYWRENFLDLSLNRDEYVNSKDLIELFKSNQLFVDELVDQDNFKEIKDSTERYIFENSLFDKADLASTLRRKKLIEETDFKKIYSENSKKLDTEFLISKQAIKEEYKKIIYLSSETKIYTDNYEELIKRQGIEYKDGKLILSVDEDFIKKLPSELRNEN